ncbi:unnamed protein product [Moneuplotes crassus]|uniref:Uncharacterized protein n=1 Tax=Euplotes crassus TaxID=5936 RepID=A0AAD2D2F2_EUPCR|nr:unnamed protein product [Moneuplotes crassus]
MMNEISESMKKGRSNNEKLMTMRALIVKNLELIKDKGAKISKDQKEKQEKRIQEISDRYEEAKQIANKTFEIVEGQLQKLEGYVDEDIAEKEHIDQEYTKQLSEAVEIVNLRFEQESQSRAAFEKKFKTIVNQKFELLKSDLLKESQARNASLMNLEQSIESDFSKIESEIKETAENAEQTDQELNKIFDDLIDRVTEENEHLKNEKESTEQRILEQLKTVNKVRDDLQEVT